MAVSAVSGRPTGAPSMAGYNPKPIVGDKQVGPAKTATEITQADGKGR